MLARIFALFFVFFFICKSLALRKFNEKYPHLSVTSQFNIICRKNKIVPIRRKGSGRFVVPETIEYLPPEVGSEIYIGTAAGLFPIVWATYEFSKRIITQRECMVCKGSGVRINRYQ